MNNIDKKYTDLLQDILDNGVKKETRNGGTISVFGRQIRHKMSEGFPLLTTKKIPFRLIATELMWFLRGDTNIKYLVDNDCHIWDGDAYKNYERRWETEGKFLSPPVNKFTKEEFINEIKTNPMVAKELGELGPIYGKQWRNWCGYEKVPSGWNHGAITHYKEVPKCDQLTNLINDLKTNPDSRRLMVSAWNVGELDQMTLPPCHYGFQVYTRELTYKERIKLFEEKTNRSMTYTLSVRETLDSSKIPTRAISLMWNQRSVDTFLGLPFNIASYGLLLEIIATAVNMVPDELIGNLGDTHLYLNHIEQAKEQIGREYTEKDLADKMIFVSAGYIQEDGSVSEKGHEKINEMIQNLPKRTREPYPLPTLNINTEFWPTESGECGVGSIDAVKVFESFKDDNFCKCLLEDDIQLGNYQSHPHIKAPLSN